VFVFYLFILILIFLLFICAYNAWVISPPCPHPLPYHTLHPLPLPLTPSIPGRNYFALISNFVEERQTDYLMAFIHTQLKRKT
jgi:hypothetical protein